MKLLTICAKVALSITILFSSVAFATPITFDDLGNIGVAGTFTFDTEGTTSNTNLDTELAIWNATGTLLGVDDDSGSGFLSSLTIALTDGVYFVGLSEWDSIFGDGFTNTGSAFEPSEVYNMVLNINGILVGEGVASAALDQETLFFKVTVGNIVIDPVSAPSVAAMLGLALITIGYRSRQNKQK